MNRYISGGIVFLLFVTSVFAFSSGDEFSVSEMNALSDDAIRGNLTYNTSKLHVDTDDTNIYLSVPLLTIIPIEDKHGNDVYTAYEKNITVSTPWEVFHKCTDSFSIIQCIEYVVLDGSERVFNETRDDYIEQAIGYKQTTVISTRSELLNYMNTSNLNIG